MSWWVYLQDHTAKPRCDFGTPMSEWKPQYEWETEPCPAPCYPSVDVDSHTDGGTYVAGGSSEAELNVTYNYGGHFKNALGERFDEALEGKRAVDVVLLLEKAVEHLGTERSQDYWESTPGNAGYALSILLRWARLHPEAIFHIS